MSMYLLERYDESSGDRAVSGFLIYLIATVLVYFLPYTKATAPYVLAGLLMLSFLPVAMLKENSWFNYGVGLAVGAVIIGMFSFLNGAYGVVDVINELVRTLRFFLPVLWFAYFARYGNLKQRNIFLAFFACLCVFILINTMIALEENPMIARILAQGKESDDNQIREYRLQNVAGFEFAYMSGAMTLCFVWLAQQSKKIWQRVCCILVAVTLFYYIIQTMYTILLLLTAIGVLVLLFLNTKHAVTKCILVGGFVLLTLLASQIFGFLAEAFTEFPELKQKMEWLQDAFSDKGVDALGSRPQLIMDALETWLKSPIWGSAARNVDAHSTVFALLANNGLIGMTIWSLMMYFGYKTVSSALSALKAPTRTFNVAFLYLAALSVFNPTDFVFEIPIVVFFVIPLISTFFAEKDLASTQNEP